MAKKAKKPTKTQELQAENERLKEAVGRLNTDREVLADALYELLHDRVVQEISEHVDDLRREMQDEMSFGCCHF